MKLAVLMDKLDKIKAYKDSSVAMLKSAQQRGFECFFFTQDDLYIQNGEAFASSYKISVLDESIISWASVDRVGDISLVNFDIILVRLDPPFNMEYLYTLQILELAKLRGVLVANRPSSLCMLGEKMYTTHFSSLCPPTLVSASRDKLKAFWQQYQDVIFKPLDAMGGRNIFHVNAEGANLSVILDFLTSNQQTMIMAQQYIPEITTGGDKRILLINGKPIPYALARMPAKGDFRGNLDAGASGRVVELTTRDYAICDKISQSLQDMGLYFVGIDVIGDYLTEINITSPTCIVEITQATGIDISGEYIDFLAQIR